MVDLIETDNFHKLTNPKYNIMYTKLSNVILNLSGSDEPYVVCTMYAYFQT